MIITSPRSTVDVLFFKPIVSLVDTSLHAYPCREFPDLDFVRLGIARVLEASPSGRGFLQEHGERWDSTPELSNYFATLRSARRGKLLADIHSRLIAQANQQLSDRLADLPGLAAYECFAADGHWHQAASHDPRHDGTKMAVGHFYSLNLRTHTLRHLCAAEGWHEHEMSALKRVKPKGLRQAVPTGRRVLIVYDKAGIDFTYWKRCRQETAVYFVSRMKNGTVYDDLGQYEWDQSDPRNRGVLADRRVMTQEGILLRIVSYLDPVSGVFFEFLTNVTDLLPGVIAELYRRRWEAEKVFDQIKNKLGEKKAWGSTQEAREAQARLVAITHNLLLLYESHLEKEHGLRNRLEDQRRAKRLVDGTERCTDIGYPISTLVTVKFVRWIRQSLRDGLTEAAAVLRLRALYAYA